MTVPRVDAARRSSAQSDYVREVEGPSSRALVWTLASAAAFAVVWVCASSLQTQVEGLKWALLDVVEHAALAGLLTVWLGRRWGMRPLFAGCLAAVLIDLDHFIAQRSLDVHHVMTIEARPVSHSLAGVLVLSLTSGLLQGWRVSYAVVCGLLSHILRDAVEPMGVPLWAPVNWNPHVMLPGWIVLLITGACLVINVWLFARRSGGRAPDSG